MAEIVLTKTRINAGVGEGVLTGADPPPGTPLAAGDADVITPTLQLVLPGLDQITVLASITDDRIPLAPDAPTMGEIAPDLSLSLWNGLFVTKDTPQDVRDKIIAVAKETVLSERAQQIAKDTGAQVYWQDAEGSATRIASDGEMLGTINAMLE